MSRKLYRAVQTGIFLILLGSFFLYENIAGGASTLEIIWKYLPLLFVWIGLDKAVAYFVYSGEAGLSRPLSLSPALLWIGLGIFLFLGTSGAVPSFAALLGNWWPAFLILTGVGKLVDHLLPNRSGRLLAGEVIFLIGLALVGITTQKLAGLNLSKLPVFHLDNQKFHLRELHQNAYRHSTEDKVALDGAKTIHVVQSGGNLQLSPAVGNEVVVILDAKIYADSDHEAKRRLAGLKLSSAAEAGTLRLNLPDLHEENSSAEITGRVMIPAGVALKVENNLGDVFLDGLSGEAEVSVKSGSIKVRQHKGNLRLSDRYERISLESCEGEAVLSGWDSDIKVDDHSGNIQVDGKNGKIRIRNLKGNARCVLQYAELDVKEVDGTVSVQAPQSTVVLNDLRGDADFDTTSESVYLENLTGNLKFKAKGSEIVLKGVTGVIEGEASSGDVKIDRPGSSVTLRLQKVSCQLDGVPGAIKISDTLEDVILRDCTGPMEIDNQNAAIIFRSLPANPAGRISATAQNGDIRFQLAAFPANHRIFLAAEGGSISSSFSQPAIQSSLEQGQTRWQNFTGPSAQASLACQTKYGDIVFSREQDLEEE